MTNGERNLENAVQALNAGKLNDFQATFVKKVKNYTKKELKGLSSKQYALLEECADKA